MLRNDQPMLIPVDAFIRMTNSRNPRDWDDEFEAYQEVAKQEPKWED